MKIVYPNILALLPVLIVGLFLCAIPSFAHAATISGTVYDDFAETTPLSSKQLAVSINGAAAAATTTTSGDGTYSFTGLTYSANDIITLYIDGATEDGVVVTKAPSSDITGVKIYKDYLVARCDNSCSLTNSNIDTANNNGDSDIASIYSFSFGALVLASEKSFLIPASHTFAPGGNVTVGGSFRNNGTYTKSTETVTLTSTSSTATLTSGGSSFHSLTQNGSGGTYTLQDALTLTGSLTITAGTLDVSATGCSGVSCNITVGRSWSNAGTFTARTGTVTLNSSDFFNTFTPGSSSFYNLTHNSSTGYVMDGDLTVTNVFTISAGPFTTSAGTITLSGTTGTPFVNSGTFSDTTGTVAYIGNNSGGNTTIATNVTYNNLILNNASETYALGAAATLNGNLTITAGTLDDAGFGIDLKGNWSNAGSYTGSGTVTFSATSGTKTLTSGGVGTTQDFQNITKSGGGTLRFATNAVDIDGTLTINSSNTVDINGQNITVGTLVNNGTFLMEGGETITITVKDTDSGTVQYDGTSSYTIALAYGNTYYNLTFAGSGGVWEPDGNVTVNNNLTLTSGTFDIDGRNLTVTGTFSNNATLRLLGTETVSLTPDTNSGTISYDNSSALTDFPSPFNDTYFGLTLAGAGTVTLANNVTAGGAMTINSGATLDFNGYNPTIAGDFTNSGTLNNAASRTFTLNGTFQTFNPGNITLDTLAISSFASAGSNFTVSSLISVALSKAFSLGSFTITSNGSITNSGTIDEETGKIIDPSSSFYIADSSFDMDEIILLGIESLYISITDEDGNKTTSANSLTGITVSCPTDSEALTLTETGGATEVFRNSGLATAVYAGSATNNNGTLTCASGTTITATYTDAQDSSDTQSDTASATSDTLPTAPSSFSGSVVDDDSITWSWTDNSNNETGFKLYDGSSTLVATIATANTTSYTETGLTAATSYTRKLVSYNGAGNSSYSNSDTETTDDAPVPTPTPTPTTAPSAPVLVSPADGVLLGTGLPTFSFKKSQPADGTISSYTLTIGELAITGIPSSGSNASNPLSSTHIEDTYTAQYFNENDDNADNDTITITLKDGSSSLPIPDGTYAWYVKAIDSNTNSALSEERTISIDATAPTIHSVSLSGATASGGNTFITKNTAGELTATLRDGRALGEATVTFQKATTVFGAITSYATQEVRTYPLSGRSQSLSFTPQAALSQGAVYRYIISVTDSAGHTTSATYSRRIISGREAAQAELDALDPDTAPTETILEKLRALLPASPLNLVSLQEKALIRRQLQAEQFSKFADPIVAQFFNGQGVIERGITTLVAFVGESVNTTLDYLAQGGRVVLSALSTTGTQLISFTNDALAPTRNFLAQLDLARATADIGQRIAISPTTNNEVLNSAITVTNENLSTFFRGAATIVDSTSHTLATLNPKDDVVQFLAEGREVRVRAGLRNRNSIAASLDKISGPIKNTSIKVASYARHGYELFLDKTPTQISNVKVTSLQPTSAIVTWNTNHLTRFSKVNYGTTPTYGQEASTSLEYSDHHSVEIRDLTPNTTYYFEVMSQNGDYVYDAYYTITTPQEADNNSPASFVPQEAVITSSTAVPVFDEPHPNAKEIGKAEPHTSYRALRQYGDWVSILFMGHEEGWVKRDQLILKDQEGVSANADRSATPL